MGMRKQIILIGAGAVAVLVVSAAGNEVDTGRQDPAGQITSRTATASATKPTAPRRITMPTSGSCAR